MSEQKRIFTSIEDGVWFVKGFKEYSPTDDEIERLDDEEPGYGIDGVIPNGTVLISLPYGASDEFFFTATEIRRGLADDGHAVSDYSDSLFHAIVKPVDLDFDHIVISLGDD